MHHSKWIGIYYIQEPPESFAPGLVASKAHNPNIEESQVSDFSVCDTSDLNSVQAKPLKNILSNVKVYGRFFSSGGATNLDTT